MKIKCERVLIVHVTVGERANWPMVEPSVQQLKLFSLFDTPSACCGVLHYEVPHGILIQQEVVYGTVRQAFRSQGTHVLTQRLGRINLEMGKRPIHDLIPCVGTAPLNEG